MYTGINSEGINRELVATLECTSLNRHENKMSLAIPKTAILHIAKTLESNISITGYLTEDQVEADSERIRGILPALQYMVDLDSQVLEKKKGVTSSIIPMSSEDLENSDCDPYAPYSCKLCHTELFNSFMHCDGCESLRRSDFNLCIQCHQEGSFKDFHQMHHPLHPDTEDQHVSTNDHTGKMALNCSCQKKSNCPKCDGCVRCNCKCHTEFTHKWRFYDPRALKELLRVLEESVEGDAIEYSEETQVRLKLIADREDVKVLEAKRNLLDRLRKGSDLAATGDVDAGNEDATNADVEEEEDADVDRLQRKRPKLDQPC
jgi:hypothetical protein